MNANLFNAPAEVLLVKFDERLYFGNSNYFKDKMEAILEKDYSIEKSNKWSNIDEKRYMILDGSGIHNIDSTGKKALEQIKTTYETNGIEILLVAMPEKIKTVSFESVEEALSFLKKSQINNLL